MSNNKQSSVDYIEKELLHLCGANGIHLSWKLMDSILEQAKAMHKVEIMEAREDGHTSTYTEYDSDTKLYLEGVHLQYYNETFDK